MIAAATVLAVAGWVAGTRTEIISDFRELVPGDLPELQNVDNLQDETGVSGEIDVTVTADDITDPEVIAWMRDYRQRVLEVGGFEGDFPNCLDEETQLCPRCRCRTCSAARAGFPAGSRSATRSSSCPRTSRRPSWRPIPRRGRSATRRQLSFGIKVMPFDEQKELIDRVRARDRPAGDRRRATCRGGRAGRRPARPGRRRERLARVESLPAHDRQPARRRARPAGGLPLVQARAGAAGAGAARARVVGARARVGRGAAEPDVRDARRAGHRDRDRVQRPALGPLSRGT